MNSVKPVEMELARKAYNEDGDIDAAIQFYKSAAQNNYVLAMAQLIYAYVEKWKSASPNSEQRKLYEEEIDCWHKEISDLALQNNRDAQLELALLYFDGALGFIDHKAGHDWLLESACNGNPEAQYSLSDHYNSGLFGAERSEIKSRYWLLRAYKNRHPGAIYEIACRYHFKLNKPDKAMSLLKKSASLGLGQAQDALDTVHLWKKS
jgi:TPR repeat protein